MASERTETANWPMRPWLLAGLLGLAGLSIYLIGGGDGPGTKIGWQAAVTALFFFGPAAFAFTVERNQWKEPLVFAAIVGVVMAGLAWRAVGAGEAIADPEYGFLSGLVATGLALPLFQAGFHHARWRTPYRTVHANVWTDAICAAGSLAFLGASWLLLLILSELFRLLKIEVLADLMKEGWFDWTFSGAALGAALGVLRNEVGILGTLRRVVMVVLSILAVPLAAGLALFLVAMIVSGPEVLWQATRSATPVLLSCAAGAWVLANAILREDDEAMSGNPALRWAGLALAISILPLTVFAAISMGARVAQHGLSPERLWGLVAIAVACAYGLAWLVAVVRGWKAKDWRERLRRANLHLAVVISVVALVLALPVLDFGRISAGNQLSRLASGKVAPKKFDYEALRWDFGDAGRRALAKLEKSTNPVTAEQARLAMTQVERQWRGYSEDTFREADEIDVRVQPDDPALRTLVVDYLRTAPRFRCQDFCVALDLGPTADGRRSIALVEGSGYEQVVLPGDTDSSPKPEVAPARKQVDPNSKVEIRSLEKRYVFIDGEPVGPPLEDVVAGDEPLEAPRPRR